MGLLKKKLNPSKVDTVIGDKTVFEGKMTVYGGIRIDGAVQGNIECQGLLVVGNEGKIEGDIVADSAIVGGEVIGNISAKNRLEIISKGKVVGDIITSHLVIADGVIFQGFCHMLDHGANVNPVLDQEEMPKEVEQ